MPAAHGEQELRRRRDQTGDGDSRETERVESRLEREGHQQRGDDPGQQVRPDAEEAPEDEVGEQHDGDEHGGAREQGDRIDRHQSDQALDERDDEQRGEAARRQEGACDAAQQAVEPRDHPAACCLISSIAALNPVLVSDDPATRDTSSSSMSTPTTSSAMLSANCVWKLALARATPSRAG